VSDASENLRIKWGVYYSESKSAEGHILTAGGELLKFENGAEEHIGEVDNETLCKAIKKTNDAFVKTQAYNVPADTLHFVMLVNPATNSKASAFWNPEFINVGNKYFAGLFDYLTDILNDKNRKSDR
jgi:hypothetical protein